MPSIAQQYGYFKMTLKRKQRYSLFHDKKAIFHLKNLRLALQACMHGIRNMRPMLHYSFWQL
jgi:hypothetical protein